MYKKIIYSIMCYFFLYLYSAFFLCLRMIEDKNEGKKNSKSYHPEIPYLNTLFVLNLAI